jgi:transcriptional regulator GlxA family with amidase domain
MFIPQKNHQDTKILKTQEWIETNFSHSLSVEALAKELRMSPRNFNRRFKSARKETFVKYVQQVRIEAARKELENGKLSLDEISVRVGYENVSFFRRIFKQSTGLSPTDYKNKFFQYLDG